MPYTTTTDKWVKLAQADAFTTDVGACVKYKNLHIAIFNFKQRTQWYAIDNICPHKQQSVLSRGIVGETKGSPKVACPLHKNAFLLKTGKCVTDGDTPDVRTYDIKCENETIYLNLNSLENK